jgi:dTDP-4-amino-4,6-dideoxygalactose transaminase
MLPLVDLSRQHAVIADEVRVGWNSVVERGTFILGPEVEDFEESFASYCGVGHCIGVGNGTDALEFALRALGVGRGDTVIVPANTFIATAMAVVRAGADVSLVDCDPKFGLIDPEQLADAVTAKTRVAIPVHLYGQMAPMEMLEVAAPDLTLVEDAAQAQGASRDGRKAGSWGPLAATSFYPGKNLGAYGDAGAVLTSSDDLASRVRELRAWGSLEKYVHPSEGFNSRLDTIQAVVLSAKLARLDEWNRMRQDAARRYSELLQGAEEVSVPDTMLGNTHVWHLYVVRVANRDNVLARLRSAGIGVGVHYPIPIHLQGAMSFLGYGPGAFHETEALAREALSLPLFPGIEAWEQEWVVDRLLEALKGS